MSNAGRSLVSALPFIGAKTEIIYECRRCGESLETLRDSCQYCDKTDVCEYRIS